MYLLVENGFWGREPDWSGTQSGPRSRLRQICEKCIIVVYTSGEFAAGVIDTGGNLPLASLTQVATDGKFANSINNTSETGIDTGGAP
jgi:hypothetical protein